MPNEAERAFAALAADAERGLLLSGPELRRQAARRQSRRVAVTATATAVLVLGGLGTGWALTSDRGTRTVLPPAASATGPAPTTSAAPSTTPSAPPTPSPSTPPSSPTTTAPPTSRPPSIPGSVPGRALLSADVPGVSDFERLDDPEPLPEFCSRATFPSQSKIGVSASVRMFFRGPGAEAGSTPDDTLFNTVAVYRGDGAEEFLSQLNRAVDACPTGAGEAQFDSLGSLGLGDGSLLIDRSLPARGDDGELTGDGSRTHRYIAAVRVGDAVTLIDTRGYESVSSNRRHAESLARTAATRLMSWR